MGRIWEARNFIKYEDYDEYDSVKIYILNSVVLKENAQILILPKLPCIKA